MKVTVEDLSSVKKRLRIEVPQEEVGREVDAAYDQLKKTAKINGFRPGKAPRTVLERLFRKDVHADVTSKLLQDSFMAALKETDLPVLGSPQISSPHLDESSPFSYDATVDVRPVLGAVDFKGLVLKKTHYRPSAAEVDVQLKMLQKNMARLTPQTPDHVLAMGDIALVDYEGFVGGQPYTETQKTENFSVTLGEGKIATAFDEGLLGMLPGEKRDIHVEFPDGHPNPRLAGKTVQFKVKLNEIRCEELPPIDDDMAKKLGEYSDLGQLREKISANLSRGYDKRSEQELQEQIFEALIGRTTFELPDTLVQYELQGIIEDMERSFAYHNLSMEKVGMTHEGLAAKYRPVAEKQVRRHLILERIAEQEKLEVLSQEIDQFYTDMAANVQQSPEVIRQYYTENGDKLAMLRQTLLEKQAIALIIGASQIETVEGETAPPEEKSEAAR